MAENITQCPKCNTSFRISDAHLNTAKGSVRCGSCLYVFNARDFLVAPQEPVSEVLEVKNQHYEEDILIDDCIDESDGDDPFGIGSQVSKELSQTSSKGNADEYEFNLFERDKSEEEEIQENHDESWALDLLEEEGDIDDTPPEPAALEQEQEAHITQEFENSYYKNSFQIIDEKPSPQDDMKVLFQENTEEEPFEEEPFEEEPFEEEPFKEAPFEEIDDIHSTTKQSSSVAGSSYLDAIEPEPVEFDWQRHTSFWQSKTVWGLLCLSAAALIVFQIAWIKFDTFSVMKPYRGHYAKACEIFGCKLPDLIDRSKIKTANLVVRSHPRLKNALVVDAVLQNNAIFEQTFPTLDLIFTDKQNSIVAARRLTPGDYLGGELAGRSHMPIKQPLHITIEVSDPGKEATGYKIIISN